MKKILTLFLAAALFISSAHADSIFVPPTQTGTAATGQIPGTSTNDDAATGKVGQYVEGIRLVGSAVTFVSSAAQTVTSIALTAGDWDVNGVVTFGLGATTSITRLTATLSTTDNALDFTPGRVGQNTYASFVPGGSFITQGFSNYRLSLSGNQTVYLVGYSEFTSTATTGYGIIRARRIR